MIALDIFMVCLSIVGAGIAAWSHDFGEACWAAGCLFAYLRLLEHDKRAA